MPTSTTVYTNDHDPLDNQPLCQELVITDGLFTTVLLKIDSIGDLTIRRVGMNDTLQMHLYADVATALATAYLQRIAEMEAWQEHQAFVKAQKEAEARTAEPTLEQQYHDGLLTDEEFLKLAEQEAHEAAGPTHDQPFEETTLGFHSAGPTFAFVDESEQATREADEEDDGDGDYETFYRRQERAAIEQLDAELEQREAAEHAEQLPDLEEEDPAIYGLVPHLHCDQGSCAGAIAYNDETHTDAHCVFCGHPWKRIPATITFSKEEVE